MKILLIHAFHIESRSRNEENSRRLHSQNVTSTFDKLKRITYSERFVLINYKFYIWTRECLQMWMSSSIREYLFIKVHKNSYQKVCIPTSYFLLALGNNQSIMHRKDKNGKLLQFMNCAFQPDWIHDQSLNSALLKMENWTRVQLHVQFYPYCKLGHKIISMSVAFEFA